MLSEKTPPNTSTLLSQGILREVDLGDLSTISAASLPAREREQSEAEAEARRADEVKRGVRVCRECITTVMKRQKKVQPKRVEDWLRLYGLLDDLQKQIETALPLLSELRASSP